MLTLRDWDKRYQQQARWTAHVRRFLYQQAGVGQLGKILEVGCGTGVILSDLASSTPAKLFGVDLLPGPLFFAQRQSRLENLANANGLNLPFPQGSFDACLCHYFLLWVTDPLSALGEMVRVTRKGGVILALAEPDYGGRIDYPEELVEIGSQQTRSLKQQGADPMLGRKLKGLMQAAGCRQVTCGLMGGEWNAAPSDEELDREWQILSSDLTGQVSTAGLNAARELDLAAWQKGRRILFVPTFYAAGLI